MTSARNEYRWDGEITRLKIMDFIGQFWMLFDYSPSVREIMQGCGLSTTSTVHYHIKILRETGRILPSRVHGGVRESRNIVPTWVKNAIDLALTPSSPDYNDHQVDNS